MPTAQFTANQKAIAIAPKITSITSAFGSAFVISEIVKDRRKLRTTFHRILLGMCITDFISSTWFFMGTWPIPRGTDDVFMAAGTMGSCIAQGFFSQLSITTAYYNASLSIFYLLKIGKGWRSVQIRKVEPFLHLVPLTIGLGTSVAGVALDSYNNDYWECWISPCPADCKESWKYGDEGNCQRGDNASLYRWMFYYAFLWLAILTVTIDMIAVYLSVRKREDAVDLHNPLPEGEAHGHKFSHKVLIQGYWYCGAFYSTWIFPSITRLTQVIIGSDTPFWLICLTAMFVPIQGALNCIVYIRPRYKQYRRLAWAVRYFQRRCHICRRGGDGTEEEAPKTSSGRKRSSLAMGRFSSLFLSALCSPGISNEAVKSFSESTREGSCGGGNINIDVVAAAAAAVDV